MSLADEARAVRERIAARLRELEPLVREYNELQQLGAQMGLGESGVGSGSPESVGEARASRAGSRRGATRRPAAHRRAGGRSAPKRARRHPAQRAGGSDLAAQVLAAAEADPGRTVADYAKMLGVAPTALYRPVRQLTTEGVLIKRARQLFPA